MRRLALLVALASPFVGLQVFTLSFFASYVPGALLACIGGTMIVGLLVAGLILYADKARE